MNIETKSPVPGFDDSYTLALGLDTGPLSTDPYISPAHYELERERVFGRAWLAMGREEQVPESGSYIVRELEVCNASVLIVRQKSGGIQAFHNVCSHRQNLIMNSSEGRAPRFTCRYHSWTFGTDGALLSVPDERRFFDFDKKKCGLTPIATEVWQGWIFINMQSEPEVSLAEFLGDFGKFYTGVPFPGSGHSLKFEANLDANWKVISDAFAESYHVPSIHNKTLRPAFSNASNPFARPIRASAWGPHSAYSAFANLEYAPPENALGERLAYRNMGANNIISPSGANEIDKLLGHPSINPNNSAEWCSDANVIFPNFHLDVSFGGFFIHHFWPTSHRSTRWVAEYFMEPAADFQTRLQQEYYAIRNIEVLLEDIGNTERVQKGMETRAKRNIYLQDGEVIIRNLLHHIDRWIKADSAREALDL
ncbi:aromatic ring-hydroxylating dioxygenase subunit alpha [Sphingobium phenoxybenzoativorans]|jgi:phenylpropionate dioxygenase-like ring-hydroxylating dioxygenase large terminal subunit|uniref:Aromatic ring-hydroxylating dioxygenase subunit alpha n=1 Tax=Sphingobium phenoxybenzoativorans TaxID=1592790 RepID=A0A975Q1C3_9SPHN|nr:aromatic ring-hydroxylating dioxygenase subunit alpha [Sphingobium phenoxybenzoativorans]QUT05800.1 aromatic ring-hydroxylating dioxygenase subunit alpha [Sphingobium phenoxybenzoativorans]